MRIILLISLLGAVVSSWDYVDAKDGDIKAPMVIHTKKGFNGAVESPTSSKGSATYQFYAPSDTKVTIQVRVYAPNGKDDSFFPSIDGKEKLWHIKNCKWCYRSAFSNVQIKAGMHNFTLRARENGTYANRIRIYARGSKPVWIYRKAVEHKNFMKGADGTNTCPDGFQHILDQADCTRAAKVFKTSGQVARNDGCKREGTKNICWRPSGCFLYGNKYAYFNKYVGEPKKVSKGNKPMCISKGVARGDITNQVQAAEEGMDTAVKRTNQAVSQADGARKASIKHFRSHKATDRLATLAAQRRDRRNKAGLAACLKASQRKYNRDLKKVKRESAVNYRNCKRHDHQGFKTHICNTWKNLQKAREINVKRHWTDNNHKCVVKWPVAK